MNNWMTNIVVGAAFGAAIATGIAFFSGASSPDVIMVQDSEEVAEEPAITEEELALYIDVYRSMQDDRSLKIEDAVVGKGTTVAEFRGIERRVQTQERLIKRVREALLEQAKENASSLVERGVAVRP